MPNVAETLGIDGPLTPELGQALAAARIREAAATMLMYHCSSCKNAFDEETVEGVLKRAAANTHGSAITPELEAVAGDMTAERQIALSIARIYDNADAMLKYQCSTCKGAFDEETVEGVLKRAAANSHGSAITPELELVASK
jgi:DNA-directed RNA polymerase subunit RPC12/RpoP